MSIKVLHTVASLQAHTGGPAKSVPGLSLALAEAGCEVVLWSPDVPAGFQMDTVRVLSGGELPDEDFDLVHDHGVWLPLNHKVARWSQQRGVPRIVSPRGMLEPWSLKHKWLKKKVAWFLYQRKDLHTAGALHATAESEKESFRSLGLKQSCIISPNGIAACKAEKPVVRQKKAVFLSRIHPKKGLLLLVEAWKELAPIGWTMHVVGPDELGHKAQVMEAVQAANLAEQWHFHEPLHGEEKDQFLAEADLFILPTYSENFGISIAEALSAGTPVITTTGTPWKKLLSHRAGWWVKPEVAALQSALQEAVSLSESELFDMGQRGREWVNAEFSWPQIGKQMMGEYKRFLDGYRT